MITCCEIAITLAFTNLLSLAIFAGYTVKIRQSQINLEKKNGVELKELEKLRKEVQEIKHGNLSNLPKKESST
jgi:hypothetical protein